MTGTVWDAVLDAEHVETDRLVELAAALVERVGWDAVKPHVTGVAIHPPEPGATVLACRCGTAMDLGEMVSLRLRDHQPEHGPTLDRIVCRGCVRGELASMRDDHAEQHLVRWRNQHDVATLTQAQVDDARAGFLRDWDRDNPALARLWTQVAS